MVASAFYGSLCQFCAGFTILEHGKFIFNGQAGFVDVWILYSFWKLIIPHFHLPIMIISKKNGLDVYHQVLAWDKGRKCLPWVMCKSRWGIYHSELINRLSWKSIGIFTHRELEMLRLWGKNLCYVSYLFTFTVQEEVRLIHPPSFLIYF